MDYILLVSAAVLLAVNFALTKLFGSREGTAFSVGMLFNAASGIASAVIFFAINGFKLHFTAFSVIMALLQTTALVAYTLIGFKIMSKENVADYTFYLMTGGMTVPYIWGLLFLNEKLKMLNSAGLILIIAAVLLINGNSKKSIKAELMCAAVFLLNGAVSVISKLHQINKTAVSANEFVILTSLIKGIACLVIFLLCTKERKSVKISGKGLAITVATAAVGGISYLFQLKGAATLPATVCYPIITGGTIIFTGIAGALCFGERISKKAALGMVLCLAGTCLFL